MRYLVSLLLIVLLFGTPLKTWAETADRDPEDASSSTLRIGVRSSARPFSYGPKVPFKKPLRNFSTGSGPIQSAGYSGYMVSVCDGVLKEMLIKQDGAPILTRDQISIHNVDALVAAKRSEATKRGLPAANFDRFDLLDNEVDILCDPATISRERVQRFAVSPPLFVTGVGYLKLKTSVAPKSACQKGKALIGFVGSTNAAKHGVQTILNAGEWTRFRSNIISALRNEGTDEKPCAPPSGIEGEGEIFWAGSSHDEVAKMFCEGKITYYVGDLEIISEHASLHAGCIWSSGARSFTVDRYGIFANIDYDDDLKALLIGRFFEVLNREIATTASLLDRAFIATFGEAKRSQKLEIFFWALRGQP